jgi:thymidylate synthase (FAD)
VVPGSLAGVTNNVEVPAPELTASELTASAADDAAGAAAGNATSAVPGAVAEADDADVRFRSDVTVELVRSSASDADVLFAARVSTQGEQSLEQLDADPARSKGLINYLMRSRHGSPFEHNSMTFYVQAPIFVFREFMRHRIASYNEESGRYRELRPVFYVPGRDRMLCQVGKPGQYSFVEGTPEQHDLVETQTRRVCVEAYRGYRRMLEAGVAREVARIVLPLTIYSSMYVTLNARSLMNFLSLRTADRTATYPSSPQREIEMCAERMEGLWADLMPLTQAAFRTNGRVAP